MPSDPATTKRARLPAGGASTALMQWRQTVHRLNQTEIFMDSVDLEVLKTSARWLADGRRALLITVVKTWGSSPRPEGAMLAIRDDGQVVGSVSGGCIEDDLIERVRTAGIEQIRPETAKYGITAEEARRFGLPCGGTIQLVLEPLNAR